MPMVLYVMMIAEILIMTDRSETLVRKLYRKEALSYDAQAIFGKKLQDVRRGKVPPHSEEDGVHLYYIHRGSLYFLATSVSDVSTVAVTEFLSRLYSMAKDLCGVVTEESVRVNFLPIFEMLCAAMDFGTVQVASTERLRPFILSDTFSVGIRPSAQEEIASRMFGIDRHVASASAAHKPAVGSSVDERSLYVDFVENLTIVANSQGKVSHLKVDGTVSIQNQLPGNPTLKIALNEDLQICKPGEQKVYGKSAQLDHCQFHSDVDTSEFEAKRVLKITPSIGEHHTPGGDDAGGCGLTGSCVPRSQHPRCATAVLRQLSSWRRGVQPARGRRNQLHGLQPAFGHPSSHVDEELSAMMYNVDGRSLIVPVLVRISVQDIQNSRDKSVTIRVSPNFPHTAEAVHVHVSLPVPASVSSISQHASGPSESLTFREKDRMVLWTIHNLGSSQDSTAYVRLINHHSKNAPKTDVGPAVVEFEINRLTLSGLRLRSLKIFEGNQLCPAKRFVRYVTASDSYTVKIP